MSVTEAGQVTEWPQSLVWAIFDTLTGAEQALTELQAKGTGESPWIDVENTAIIVKDGAGNYSFKESEDLSGVEGFRNGLLIGGLLGIMTPGTSLFTMAGKAAMWLGFGGRLHDAGFEDNELRSAAEAMPPNSSALITLVTHEWLDEVVQFLNTLAYKVGWTAISEKVGTMMEDQARAAQSA
jgi:uncharacterized membrane protein